MARHHVVPAALRTGPFHVRDALEAGLTHTHLRGRSYRRLFPRVWVRAEHVMTESDWFLAGALHCPADARSTGTTRLRQLGLDVGPLLPLQFVVGRDLHRDIDGLVLHRSDRLPAHDDVGVHPVAAFVELCRWSSVLDAVAAGDQLLRQGLGTVGDVLAFCRRESWREGTLEATWVLPLLDAESRSPRESHVRTWFRFAGLPEPEVNAPLEVDGRIVALLDWWWRRYRVAAEYEGSQHQTDRQQYLVDIERYRLLRELTVDYVQLTQEHYRSPVSLVLAVHRRLAARGFEGPPPRLDARFWAARVTPSAARSLWGPRPPAWAESRPDRAPGR